MSKKLTGAGNDDGYKVGYGRPPKASQFKPGQSGNPRGRPRGSRNLATVLMEFLHKRYALSNGGKVRTVSGQEVIGNALFKKAAAGDLNAIQSFVAIEKSQEPRPVTEIITSDMSAMEASKIYQRLMNGKS